LLDNPLARAVATLDFPGAVCAGEPTTVFFGPRSAGREPGAEQAAREARATSCCARCPHRAACLEHARSRPEPDGIWGGMTALQRRSS